MPTQKKALKVSGKSSYSLLNRGTQAIDELIYQQWITDIKPEVRQQLEAYFQPCLIYNPFKF